LEQNSVNRAISVLFTGANAGCDTETRLSKSS
jgi:hypothetical protein